MIKFPQNSFVPKNQEEREKADLRDNERVEKFQANLFQEMKGEFKIPRVESANFLSTYPISQKNSIYSNKLYGKVGTVGEAGCGPLAVEYALRTMGFLIRFDEVLKECVDKGYRAYVYDEEDKIIDGSGTEYVLFDNLATELHSFKEIMNSLEKGCPVTVLMNNAVYHDDEKCKGECFS